MASLKTLRSGNGQRQRTSSASLPVLPPLKAGSGSPAGSEQQDCEFAHLPIPANQRRSALTMSLLWLTMVTGLPCLIMGFEWYRSGVSLTQVLSCTALSGAILLAYLIPVCMLGAKSGMSFVALSKIVFGRVGTFIVTANIVWVMMGWYAVTSLLLADGLTGIFKWTIPLGVSAFLAAIAMSANNLFGFRGVANFARYFAAPLVVGWVLYSFFKAAMHPAAVSAFHAGSNVSMWSAVTTISSFVLGFAVWGNEPDYWRFSKPKLANVAIPLMIAVGLGQVIFPTAGWLMGHAAGVASGGTATSFIQNFSFGGMSLVIATVMVATYFAPSDSTLYGLASAFTGHFKFKHKPTVLVAALIGGALASILAVSGSAKALESICELNAIVLPPATVVMLVEWYMQRKVWQMPAFFDQKYDVIENVRWTAVIALFTGITVGLLTSGMIPGLSSWHVGIPPLQAWLTTAVVYFVLNIIMPGNSETGGFVNLRENL